MDYKQTQQWNNCEIENVLKGHLTAMAIMQAWLMCAHVQYAAQMPFNKLLLFLAVLAVG